VLSALRASMPVSIRPDSSQRWSNSNKTRASSGVRATVTSGTRRVLRFLPFLWRAPRAPPRLVIPSLSVHSLRSPQQPCPASSGLAYKPTVTSRSASVSLFHPGEPGFCHPVPSCGLIDCGSYASVAPQHSPGWDTLSNLAPYSGGLFSSLWAIRVVYSHFWPTVTPERYNRGCFILFCDSGTGVAAAFSPLWPTITSGAGVKAGRQRFTGCGEARTRRWLRLPVCGSSALRRW
jgi:hypothetical protein